MVNVVAHKLHVSIDLSHCTDADYRLLREHCQLYYRTVLPGKEPSAQSISELTQACGQRSGVKLDNPQDLW